MRGKSVRSGRSSISRRIGVVVCAASIVGTLAGVARSQTAADIIALCFFNVTNTTNNVGSCVQGVTDCLHDCIRACHATTGLLAADCTQGCVDVFQSQQAFCVGRFNNTQIP